MTDPVARYRKPTAELPAATLTWRLHGAGMESFGRDGRPEELAVPAPGPREVLVRVDALGLCFSDIKLIGLGAEHPRVYGRNLAADPVVPGHEVSLTIVAVGSELHNRFHTGERYIVQADAIFRGEARAYGYALPGGMTQYGIIGERILDGDEGCYLLPVEGDIGYAEAALTEPWACVVAAYRIKQREGLKADGTALLLALPDARCDEYVLTRGIDSHSSPRKVITANLVGKLLQWLHAKATELDFALVEAEARDAATLEQIRAEHAPAGFDDIVVLGAGDADMVEAAARLLTNDGVVNVIARKPLPHSVQIDVGRIHYDNTGYVGGPGPDIADSYQARDSELGRGPVWFIGAGGPMGQMHVQRALERPGDPQVVVATDVDDDRLAALEAKFGAAADHRGKRLLLLNPSTMSSPDFEAALREAAPQKFSDIVLLAPVPALIEQAASHLAPGGTLNIFAGLARGTTAELDLADVYLHGMRWVGSSGSAIADLEYTLRLTERAELSPNLSVAAIGDIRAVGEGLKAVKEGRFAGKVVIFPHLEDLPLTSLSELRERLPQVYAKLGPQESWTREAEQELLQLKLAQCAGGGCAGTGTCLQEKPQETRAEREPRLMNRVAIVTGAAQGLGEAIAHRLATEGAHVVVADINGEGARKVASEIEERHGRRALAVRCDVTKEDEVTAMVTTAVSTFGRLDILVSNAGILIAGDVVEFSPAQWRKVIEVNLVGYFLCARAAAKVMREQRSGVIIQINSKSGKKGSFKNSAYAASKFGGIGLTQSLALELAPEGIRVNAVCPGNLLDSPLWVDSLYAQYAQRWGMSEQEVRRKYEEQVPLGRGCTYDDVCNVVVFLASDEAAYMTGQALNVTGGQEMD